MSGVKNTLEKGLRVGKLTLIRELVQNQAWLCRCDCGGWKIARSEYLKYNLIMSCGCAITENLLRRIETPLRKLPYYMWAPIGLRFGSLTVEERVRGRHGRWKCICDCGGKVETTAEDLYRGRITHCNHCNGGAE